MHTTSATPRRASPKAFSKVVSTITTLTLSLAMAVAVATPAAAAPGDPFDPNLSTVFLAQGPSGGGAVTTLNAIVAGPAGSTFQQVGVAQINYNAIAFNTADNFVYAVATRDGLASDGVTVIVANTVVRVGEGGYVTPTSLVLPAIPGINANGDPFAYNSAAIDAAGRFWVNHGLSSEWQVVDLATLQTTPLTMTLNGAPYDNAGVSDITYADGFMWGADASRQIVRIALDGSVSLFPPLWQQVGAGGGFGGAWTYGNGNLGIIHNASGIIYQIAVSDPGATAPTFTLVSTSSAPSSYDNDATYLGGIADLSIVKTGPAIYTPASTIQYDLTVTNNGPGTSTGHQVVDVVPGPLTAVSASGCAVSVNTVTCPGGQLLAGESVTYTVVAAVPSTSGECITNVANVVGNETDPVTDNNTDDAISCVGSTTPEKTSDRAYNSVVHPGDTINYTLTFENNTNFESTVDYYDSLAAVLDDATLTSAPVSNLAGVVASAVANDEFTVNGLLPANSVATVTYQVTVSDLADRNDSILTNYLMATGDPIPAECNAGDALCTQHLAEEVPVGTIIAVKTSDRAFASLVNPGETISYTLTFSNNSAFDAPVAYTDDMSGVLDDADLGQSPTATSQRLTVSAIANGRFTITGVLSPGESADVTYTAIVRAPADRGDSQLSNFLFVSTETVSTECVEGDPLCTTAVGGPGTTTSRLAWTGSSAPKTATASALVLLLAGLLLMTAHFAQRRSAIIRENAKLLS